MDKQKWLISIDIDGTLIKDNQEISQYDKKIINELKKLNNIIILATGRSEYGAINIYNEINIDTPMVSFNGALVKQYKKNNFKTRKKILDRKILKLIILNDELSKYIHSYIIETEKHLYMTKFSNEIYQTSHINNNVIYKILERKDFWKIPSFTLIIQLKKKIFFKKIYKYIHEKFPDTFNFTLWKSSAEINYSCIFDLTIKSMNKAYGANIIRKHYNIDIKKTLAIGDASNDIEILQWVNTSVAMNNASDDIKKIAKYTTEFTNNESGVGCFLNSYFDLKIRKF